MTSSPSASKQTYDIYLNTRATGLIKAANCVIAETHGRVEQLGFRYTPDYLAHPGAFSLDPNALPLRAGETQFECRGSLPGFLDDYLPDDWGKRVLVRYAFYKHGKRLNQHSAIDLLSLLNQRHIGALAIVAKAEAPNFDAGLPLEKLASAEAMAQQIDSQDFTHLDLDELGLLYLVSSGSGVGGARPKALIQYQGKEYLAKFNRSQDDYNNARVELACLRMAKLAGIRVGDGQILEQINGRDVLLLDRFDMDTPYRRHLISINSLLKNPRSAQDHGFNFRYDDIHRVLQHHSIAIEEDAEQLLRQMLFNRCIHNLDDHERNFSLLYDGKGYRLTPAYDMVPNLVRGQYPVAGFQYQQLPPSPAEAAKLNKIFGLPKPRVEACAMAVTNAVAQWGEIASSCGINEADAHKIGTFFIGSEN